MCRCDNMDLHASQAAMDETLSLSLGTPWGCYPASSPSAAATFVQVTPLKSTGFPGRASCEKWLKNEALNMQ